MNLYLDRDGEPDPPRLHGRHKVAAWLWMFGRGKLRLGGLSVAETAVRKSARHEEQVKRAVEESLSC